MYGAPTSSSWLPGWTIAAEAKARTPLIRFGQSTNGSKREKHRTRSSHRASRTGRRNGLGPCVPTHSWRNTRELEAQTTPQTSPARSRNRRCGGLSFLYVSAFKLCRALQSYSVFRKATRALRSSSDNLNLNGWSFTAYVLAPQGLNPVGT